MVLYKRIPLTNGNVISFSLANIYDYVSMKDIIDNINGEIKRVIQYHKNGYLQSAENIYKQVLTVQPYN